MRIVSGSPARRLVGKLASRGAQLEKLEPKVRRIIDDLRCNGGRALRRYAQRWDSLRPGQPLQVTEGEMAAALKSLHPELKKALKLAAGNIRRFASWQKPAAWMKSVDGISLGQVVRPLESVGCYVPGGRHPLVSTLLMTVIPAQVAGVQNIRVVSPNPSPEVLGAAAMLGVREFYRVGGAQAVAALAYGADSIPAVSKIVGPGNSYVTVAKKLVCFDCAIDFLAGPTEALVLSEAGNPEFIAADLVAQVEHDPEALALLITTSEKLAKQVANSVTRAARESETAQAAIKNRGAILVAPSRSQARVWANQIAAEHITVPGEDVPYITNAGSIFVGDYSAQAAGDYATGPNHVLPTGAQARVRGGLSVMDFVKISTVQRVTKQGLLGIAPAVELLAEAEGLAAHAKSIRVRREHA